MNLTPRQARLRENLLAVREQMETAAIAAGRSPDDVTLVAVTKYVAAEVAWDLVAAGCHVLGESRPQQLWAKAESITAEWNGSGAAAGIRWHMIGHLQRNKVERTLPLVSLIHSVDSARLLAAIHQAATAQNRQSPVLLEVNTSGEAEKHGLDADEVLPLIEQAHRDFPGVRICGLMTMAARDAVGAAARRSFAQLRELRDRLTRKHPPGVHLAELSMGMSGDFSEAILEGATLIRVGSALFEGIA